MLYFNRLSSIAGNMINCGAVLNWFEASNILPSVGRNFAGFFYLQVFFTQCVHIYIVCCLLSFFLMNVIFFRFFDFYNVSVFSGFLFMRFTHCRERHILRQTVITLLVGPVHELWLNDVL